MAIASGIIAGGLALGGAYLSSRSSNKAADKAADAARDGSAANIAAARENYSNNAVRLDPSINSGLRSGGALTSLLLGDATPGTVTSALSGFDQFRNSTNYQWRLGEGNKALNQGFAANRMLESGAALKGFAEYNQNFASNELGTYMDRLAQQQGFGLTAAGALAGVSTNTTGQIIAANNNAASATGNAALIRGQNTSNMYGQVAGALGGLASSFGGR